MRRLGVLGWPVGHSLSPVIQQAALDAAGLDDWSYQLLPVPSKLFVETVCALPQAGFVGVNVTIPHKERALALADTASFAASYAGAANTLTFAKDGRIEAENTDLGALRVLVGSHFKGRAVLILGAGGSARAALLAAYWESAKEIYLYNRHQQRGQALIANIRTRMKEIAPENKNQHDFGIPVSLITAQELRAGGVDVDCIINCTPVGMNAKDDPLLALPLTRNLLRTAELVVDFVYHWHKETQLIQAAKAFGLHTVDGLALLLEQAALSFAIWTGKSPAYDAMRHALAVYQSKQKKLLKLERHKD